MTASANRSATPTCADLPQVGDLKSEIFEFIHRARDLLNLHRHDLTGEQMRIIREIIEKAEALKVDALITDLPKRLTKLEAELPTLSSSWKLVFKRGDRGLVRRCGVAPGRSGAKR